MVIAALITDLKIVPNCALHEKYKKKICMKLVSLLQLFCFQQSEIWLNIPQHQAIKKTICVHQTTGDSNDMGH